MSGSKYFHCRLFEFPNSKMLVREDAVIFFHAKNEIIFI